MTIYQCLSRFGETLLHLTTTRPIIVSVVNGIGLLVSVLICIEMYYVEKQITEIRRQLRCMETRRQLMTESRGQRKPVCATLKRKGQDSERNCPHYEIPKEDIAKFFSISMSLSEFYFLHQQDGKGNHILHLLCKTGASVETIRMAHSRNATIYSCKNFQGHFPIHLACKHRSSLEVVQFLYNIDRRHDFSSLLDGEGKNLLHLACEGELPPKPDVMAFLIEVSPFC